MTDEKPTAWGYVRLSQQSDSSIEEQKREIREYAEYAGFNLATTRNDGEGTSGFDLDRHEYNLIRDHLGDGTFDAIITSDRARLSRDFDDRLSLILEFRSVPEEWHVVEKGGPLNVDDIQNAAMEGFFAMMDHINKKKEIRRAKKATKQRIERGCYQGHPPMGLQFADDGCHLERSDGWESVELIFELLGEGHSPGEIAEDDRVGVGAEAVRKMKHRGFGYYTDLLNEYGVD